ncbi:hypothetical protein Dimus_002101 [Dionaea muscipula]
MAIDPLRLFMNVTRRDQFPRDPYDDDGGVEPQLSLASSSETYMVGFVIANIVGTQYYSGTISGREMVGLVREPLNPYDENAIKVLNTRGVQVGHIERAAARVFAPLIDSEFIAVEGIVPKPPGGSRGNRFKIPCQFHIFAVLEAFPIVREAISDGGLQLILDNNPSFALSESASVKETRNKDGVKGVDEIFRLVDENVSSKAAMAPLEPPKDVITSQLFAHQKEGLGWLVHRENTDELPPFWEEKKDGMFVNVLTNYQSNTRPEPLRGGIFADDMGMGKTLTLLSLIAFDKCGAPASSVAGDGDKNVEGIDEEEVDGDESLGRTRKAKRGRQSKKPGATMRKKHRSEEEHDNAVVCSGVKGKSRTTLVVCPPSVFSTWVNQLSEHTRRGSLKAYMYYGERTQDPEELKMFDIVLTTYSTLASEASLSKSPIKEIDWWRVILDEAHLIKNPNCRQTHAVTGLKANRRWAVTGTPIQNSSNDLFSLMAFLRFDPFSNKGYWNSLVQRPLAQGNEAGLSRLQVLMATISFRRTKDKNLVGLPSKSVETCFVELSSEERELYDQLELEAKAVVRSYIHTESVTRNYTTVLTLILRLRQICTDMALCPHDIKSLLPANNIEDVSNNPELLKKMVSLLQNGEDFDCPICISPPTDMVITCCAHIFCRACIFKTIKHTKRGGCPMCRRPLSESDLYAAPPPESCSETDGAGSSSRTTTSTSSKVSALMKILSEVKARYPETKSVVFSQFQKMLLLLEEALRSSGFKALRLDGSMNARKRAQVIEEFSSSSGPTILLASLKAAGLGINLTAASRVYLLEPWWNPAAEEQAMDRVHRIGQKEEVKIVRLIARDTIEGRVLELQERKQKLAKEAFGKKKKTTKDNKEVNVDDLRMLMSL